MRKSNPQPQPKRHYKPAASRKTERLNIRLTPPQHAALIEQAAAAGLAPTAYAHQLLTAALSGSTGE